MSDTVQTVWDEEVARVQRRLGVRGRRNAPQLLEISISLSGEASVFHYDNGMLARLLRLLREKYGVEMEVEWESPLCG